jgi:RimJ/RimL family protein N-acetyltransferase
MTMTRRDLFSFGALLKTFRTRCHLTQKQLATALGMHRHAIGRWEQGDNLPESKALVLELGRHLKLDDQEIRQLLEASLTALAPYWLSTHGQWLVIWDNVEDLTLLDRFLPSIRSGATLRMIRISRYVGAVHEDGQPWLGSLVIHKDHQRQGLGSEAFRCLAAYGWQELGWTNLRASVKAYNEAGRAFLEYLGFHSVKRGEERFSEGMQEYMVYDLALKPQTESSKPDL